MAESKVVESTPEVKEVTPVVEKLVEVELSTQFTTNDDVYGLPESEDEDGNPVYTTVKVSADVAEDLTRRQRAYDRMKRELVTSRNLGRLR